MNPGSDEAVEAGCTCDVEKNKRGAGQVDEKGDTFWMVKMGCPLHGKYWFPWLQDGLSTPRKA